MIEHAQPPAGQTAEQVERQVPQTPPETSTTPASDAGQAGNALVTGVVIPTPPAAAAQSVETPHSGGTNVLSSVLLIALLLCVIVSLRKLKGIERGIGHLSRGMDAKQGEIIRKFDDIGNSIHRLPEKLNMNQNETHANTPPAVPIRQAASPETEVPAASTALPFFHAQSPVAAAATAPAPEQPAQERYSHEAAIKELDEIERQARRYKRELEASAKHFADFVERVIEIKDELEPIAEQVRPYANEGSESTRALVTAWVTALDRIIRQWNNLFADYEIHDISPAAGDGFVDKSHTIIKPVVTQNMQHDGKVERLLEKGYRLENRILRPAKVAVWKYTPDAPAP